MAYRPTVLEAIRYLTTSSSDTDFFVRLLGIGAADITKLKVNGFYTVAVCTLSRFTWEWPILAVNSSLTNQLQPQSVHGATRRTLLKIKGFSEIKVEKIKEAIQKCQVRFDIWV